MKATLGCARPCHDRARDRADHISIFDYIAVSGSLENRVLEYVEHLHERFLDPVVIRGGR